MRFTKEMYELMDKYCALYAKRILDSDNPAGTMSAFDFSIASENMSEGIVKKYGKEEAKEEIKERVVEYAKRRIPGYFLSLQRDDLPVELAETFIRDKGSRFFKEFNDVKNTAINEKGIKPNNYRATRAQLGYIERLGYSVIHEEEFTGREADEVIRCARTSTRTKPLYFSYFAKADAERT